MKSQKVQTEQLRKAQKAKDIEEESAKGKTEVKKKTRERLFRGVAYDHIIVENNERNTRNALN